MALQRYCQRGVSRLTWDRFWFGALRAANACATRSARSAVPARRGPKPRQSDAQLLAAIRADLARSPFQGEGHRKVHARLRILDGIRVARTRVLRVMRAHGLLSPHRGRQGAAIAHDGTITTQAPNVMWGTDGVRVFTVDDGWVWIFAAVEHWNAECVGWHACKVGSRFAALEPIAQGLQRIYGSVDADVARGLALRMDHGSQYLSDHFLNQIRYWGVRPSFGFVEEPETNGAGGAVEPHAQGASDSRPHLSEPRGCADRRRRVRRAIQHDLAARAARVSHPDRGARGARATPGGVAQTCVQRTGCGTVNTEHAVDAGNDGLVVLDDGTKYVSSVRQGTVSRIRPGQLAEIVASGIPSATSMAYDSKRNRLLIPMNNWNAITFVDLD